MSTTRRRSAKHLKDSDGRVVCSCGCGRHPQPPRRHWFSDACVEAWRSIHDAAYIRQQVKKRDHGICALCGCDADAAYHEWLAARKIILKLGDCLIHNRRFDTVWERGRWVFTDAASKSVPYREYQTFRERLMEKYGPPGQWTPGRTTGWDADHIVPVVEGGGECGLENYRTLCHPCHKRVTADLAARRAKARRPQLELSLP